VHTFSPRINTMPGLSRFIVVSLALVVGTAVPAYAQAVVDQSGPVSPPSIDADAPAPPPAPATALPDAGPTLINATAGIHANTAHEDLTAAEAAHRAANAAGGGGLNKGAILLVVGGAALAAGVLIGGTGGGALAIGGALVALYGLYLILQ
jgi:hypothetical protein